MSYYKIMPRNHYTNTIFPTRFYQHHQSNNNSSNPVLANRVAQSYATAIFELKEDEDAGPRKPEHDVLIQNPMTGEFIPVPVLSDTGNDITLLTEDWAPRLGFDLNNPDSELNVMGVGGAQRKAFFAFDAVMRIGELRPIRTKIAFGPTPKNLLGRESSMGSYEVTYTANQIKYTETSSGFETIQESYHNAIANRGLWKAAASRNAQQGYRNRI
jgi:hypothetical protein